MSMTGVQLLERVEQLHLLGYSVYFNSDPLGDFAGSQYTLSFAHLSGAYQLNTHMYYAPTVTINEMIALCDFLIENDSLLQERAA